MEINSTNNSIYPIYKSNNNYSRINNISAVKDKISHNNL
jgi:hypothetical protein